MGSRQRWRRGGIVVGLELRRWDHPQLAVQAAVVEPVDVVHRGVLDVVQAAPGAAVSDQLALGAAQLAAWRRLWDELLLAEVARTLEETPDGAGDASDQGVS